MKNKKPRVLVIAHKYVPDNSKREWPRGDSMTVPDDSYSLKELLTRFVKGQPVSAPVNEGQFTGDHNYADFDAPDLEKAKHLDMVDKTELADRMRERNMALRKRAEEQEKQRNKKASEEASLLDEIKNDFKSKKSKKAAGVGDSDPKPAEGGQE